MAPALAQATKAETGLLTLEQAEAAWDGILAPRQRPEPVLRKSFDKVVEPARPQLWDYVQKAAPEPDLDPFEVEDRWHDVDALAAPSIAEQQANLTAFVGQLARAIKERPADKASHTPDQRWTDLTRADKAALRPPRPSNDHRKAGN